MRIHLTTHLEMAHEELETLRAVIDVLHERGHSLTKNWIEPQYFRFAAPISQHLDWDVICRQQPALIKSADLVIAEASGYGSFGVGYQVALAKNMNKPTLILTKNTPPFGAYIDGLNFDQTTVELYSVGNLKEKIEKFVKKYENV